MEEIISVTIDFSEATDEGYDEFWDRYNFAEFRPAVPEQIKQSVNEIFDYAGLFTVPGVSISVKVEG